MPIAHSYFSLRYGILKPEEVLSNSVASGYDRIIVADINNTSATLDYFRLGPKHGVKPVPGVDFRVGAAPVFIAVALTNEGWQNICALLSGQMATKEPPAVRAPRMEGVAIIYPYKIWEKTDPLSLGPDEYIGIRPEDLNRWRFSASASQPNQCLAMPAFSFRSKADFNTHRLLRAIDNNVLLSKLAPGDQALESDEWMSRSALEAAFAAFPFLVKNADTLCARCTVGFDIGNGVLQQNQRTFTASESEDFAMVRRLSIEGMPYRYPTLTEAIMARLDKELEVIREKGYLCYFLIAHDLCAYARDKNYFYVGRGSGANSLVAFLLRITDVDPIELDLYFERFINLYRQNPPDFDLDFSWADREDITDYLFKRHRHVCLLAAYGTFQFRAAIRELGKVFGLNDGEMDHLASGRFNPDSLDSLSKLTLRYAEVIRDFPNILSIHAGGVLITERPIQYFSATFMPPKGYPTVMFDMVVAEDAGIYKFDILSQRGLGKIKDAAELARTNRPLSPPEDIHNIGLFKSDERVRQLLRSARAIGCFYVESPAMRMLLTKLRVDDYLGLVAASSVIRPGVARSGMMRQFILRHRQPEKRSEAPPALLELMPETYGVMVYQEDVIKVAHLFAGLDLGEADVLRRGMSGKFRSREEFDRARQAFFVKAASKGHVPELVAEVWRQMESFAGYAFAKGHSASYAVESYQSLYLKAYYPIEYMCATLNNGGGFYSPELYVHEARLCGATITAPCVNRSGALCRVQGDEIILGFGMVKGLEHATTARLLKARAQGPFEDLADCAERAALTREQAVILVRCGAFSFTGRDKKALLWDVFGLLGHAEPKVPVPVLFRERSLVLPVPPVSTLLIEDAYDELDLLGFTFRSPFELLAAPLPPLTPTAQLAAMNGREVTAVGYLITAKPTKTATGQLMKFGTWLCPDGLWLDTVHFPPSLALHPFTGPGIYLFAGRVAEEFEAVSIEVSAMRRLPYRPDPRLEDLRTSEKIRRGMDVQGLRPYPS